MSSQNALAIALQRLAEVATVTPEYTGDGVAAAVQPLIARLIEAYPRVASCSEYLDFLRIGGGAHISNRTFSLGVYGFEGYVVASLEERALIDQDRYFLFGESLMLDIEEEVFLFLDLAELGAPVCWQTADDPTYRVCCTSFTELLIRYAHGTYCNMSVGPS
jgi:hypothetical protein